MYTRLATLLDRGVPVAQRTFPAHGETREDGWRFDRTLAYGGGWLSPENFERRAAGQAVSW